MQRDGSGRRARMEGAALVARKGTAPLCLAAALMASVSATAQAQTAGTADHATVEEIVVTARRGEERLQSTPIAVSAFTSARLEQAGATSLTDVAAFVPNLTMSSTG